jgi:ribonuclease Z
VPQARRGWSLTAQVNKMPSYNLASVKIEDFEIIGYSVAGEETVVAMPQLDVCFDIGKAPTQVIPINHVLLTHGHMDHSAGIAYYLSHRHFCGQSAGTVLAPQNLLKPLNELIDVWARIDGNKIPANLVGVKPGDEYSIKPNLFARIFPTKHSKGSVGYSIIERRKKLKPEYSGFTGPQIVELKKQGVVIDYPIELPIVTYLGDTQFVDFSQLNYITESKILIAECTFYQDEHAPRAEAGRHMHISEFAGLIQKLHNKYIVITHTTQRTSMREIQKILKDAFSAENYEKVVLLMDRKYR